MARRTPSMLLALTLCLLAPLAAHALLGSYSRFIADDFCSAGVAQARGLWGGTAYWYEHWTGRYAANFLDTLAGLSGQSAVRAGPALALALWLPLLSAVVYALLPAAPRRLATATLLAAGVLFTTLAVAPRPSQSLYWGQGMRSVIPPLILLTAFALLLTRVAARQLPVAVLASAGATLTLAAAGFNETFTAAQIVVLGGALVAAWAWGGQRRCALAAVLAVALVAALVGLALVVTAPGNALRQASFPPPPSLPMLAVIATVGAVLSLGRYIALDPPALLSLAGLLALGVWIGAQAPRPDAEARWRLRLARWLLPAAALGLAYLCFLPAAYGMSDRPPPRTLVIPAYALACAAAAEGYLLGLLTTREAPRRRRLVAAGLAALAAAALWTTGDLLRQAPAYSAYAAAWDATDARLRAARAAGDSSAAIPIDRNPAGLEDVGPDPTHWVNGCVSDYYGLTVTATP